MRRKSIRMEILAALPRWPEAKPAIHIARDTGYTQAQVTRTIRNFGLKTDILILSDMRRVFDCHKRTNHKVRAFGVAGMDWDRVRAMAEGYLRERGDCLEDG